MSSTLAGQPADRLPDVPGVPASALERLRANGQPAVQDDKMPSNTPGARAAGGDREEQALEWHEVIELQTFSERKAWIEEKIKFLETLPPIQAFGGLDALRQHTDECPDLPSAEKLQQWIAEHDIIEKETETFDKGELRNLRQLTKAATQRNLSPADTDLIEITLTTIYSLDKLLHLLRDRSENLELLGIRLEWERSRTAAWKERRKILNDLDTFVTTRARWSPSVYENVELDTHAALSRRGSIASLNSVASEPSINPSNRYKGELLSRDAAQLSARTRALCQGDVAQAGKHLDKLIDHSRKPVPDELLDEQDRLEEKSNNELDNVGKFAMGLALQWRKADDIYTETMKDQQAVKDLIEEIKAAGLQHPTSQRTTEFLSRITSIQNRLAVRDNPSSRISTFPKPEHPLYPEQTQANESLATSLSEQLSTAKTLLGQAEVAAKEYRRLREDVGNVEAIVSSANDTIASLSSMLDRLRNGVPAENDEGHPPTLASDDCLNASKHTVFLALLPSTLSELSELEAKVGTIVKTSHRAFTILDHACIDSAFKAKATQSIQQLRALCTEVGNVAKAVSQRVQHLKQARNLSTLMVTTKKEMNKVRDRAAHEMEGLCWKQESSGTGAPLTPESPALELAPAQSILVHNLASDLASLNSKLTDNIDSALATLSPHLGDQLCESLLRKARSLRHFYENLVSMQEVSKAVQEQAQSMSTIQEEYNAFLLRIEDSKQKFATLTTGVLNDRVSLADSKVQEDTFKAELTILQDGVADFIDGLAKRVKFVARLTTSSPNTKTTAGRRIHHRGKSEEFDENMTVHLPIDLAQLDGTVRSDSNAYVMRLSGALESISRASEHLTLAQLAKELDASLASTIDTIYQSQEHTKTLKASFASIVDAPVPSETLVEDLDGLSTLVDEAMRTRRLSVSRCFSPLRDILRRMDTSSLYLDSNVRQTLYVARVRSVDDAESRYHSWSEEVARLKDSIGAARAKEVQRLEAIRLAEEQRRKEEEAKKLAEEAEKRRLEEEERLKEEARRAEEERRLEAERLEQERLRREAEEAERLRLEKQREAAEELARLQQKEEAARARELAEKERVERDEADKARLRQERLEMEAKLQQAEALLAEERTRRAEQERQAQKDSEEERRKMEAEKKQMQTAIKEAQNRLARAESDARKAVGDEKKKLEYEIKALKAEHNKAMATYKKSKEALMVGKSTSGSGSSGYPAIQEDDDVFGSGSSSAAPSSSKMAIVKENNQMLNLISGLHKRLHSLHINEVARPSKKSVPLPTRQRAESLRQKFASVRQDASELPPSFESASVNAELKSLNSELEDSSDLLAHIDKLVEVTETIEKCDTVLSDLLEHVDSYPELPLEVSSLHISEEEATPEQQIVARLTFTKQVMDEMHTVCNSVPHDRRALAEKKRLHQTWLELEEMANDRMGGKKSRPPSAINSRISSGRSSVASSTNPSRAHKKRASYANLSVSSTKGGMLAPPLVPTAARRSTSGEPPAARRSSSRMSSTSTTRSVSGPVSATLFSSTFASRQRTTSLSSTTSTPRAGAGTPSGTRGRAPSSSTLRRTRSPTVSGVSSSTSTLPPPRSTASSNSSWSRAPRDSLSSIVARAMSPPSKKPTAPVRKKYVANPANKLDVAVGDVVNSLPVGINVEGVTETWRDQSGKYWIGNQDPKLCFCRILRSQTVMVRVGGGWMELSKFITNHFADSFRLVPESPSRLGVRAQEEKWISSATLLEAAAENGGAEASILLTPPRPPKTPEPTVPFVPSFSLLTPGGQSPRSIKSNSPSASASAKGAGSPLSGSPLTPLQFMRRAEPDPNFVRPGTPSKAPRVTRNTPATTSSRPGVWRP